MTKDLSLRAIIDDVEKKCLSWLDQDESGNCVVVDPNEGEPIGAHYAMTHLAAALIIGHNPQDGEFKKGLELTHGILSRWGSDSKLPAFHNDFNNMGLCLIEERLSELGVENGICQQIITTVMATPDSNNPTVNWLPMRIYVNLRRKSWGFDGTDATIEKINSGISKAWNSDGFIEDRLPKGVSFNLQYDVATVAVLAFLNARGQNYDIDKGVEALINALGPDGDINYLGRGCNQIFAWGLWLYLLKKQGQLSAFELSLDYLKKRYGKMLQNNNLLLNGFAGSDRDFWWDYHYASVYTAHFLLWLVLCEGLPEAWADEAVLAKTYGADSGVKISRYDNVFITTFSGRKEYLAEHGPMVAELWTRKHGVILKGAYGPWLKKFGEKYSTTGILLNHFGLIKMGQTLGCSCSPVFSYTKLDIVDDKIIIEFSCKRGTHTMNIPLLNTSASEDLQIFCDGRPLAVRELGLIKNQYGYVTVIQSKPSKGRNWRVEVWL